MTLEQEAALIEQEHRRLRQIGNLWTYGLIQDPKDPRRDAARKAFVWGMFTTAGTVAIVGAVGLIPALLGLWLAYRANMLVENQNEMIRQQTTLVANQNELIEKQNGMIQMQNELSEANRRALASGEMTAIAERLTDMSLRDANSTQIDMYPVLAQRIGTYSRSLKPYVYLEWTKNGPSLVPRPISIERGQLFSLMVSTAKGLIHNYRPSTPKGLSVSIDGGPPVKAEPTDKDYAALRTLHFTNDVFAASDFSFAQLNDVRLNFPKGTLKDIHLESSDLLNAQLTEMDAAGLHLTGANLRNTQFDKCSIKSGVFDEAIASNLRMNGGLIESSSFKKTHLDGASLAGVLNGCTFNEADLSNADLSKTTFLGNTFLNCSFDGALLPPVESFKGTSIEKSKFLNAVVPQEDWLEKMRGQSSIDYADMILWKTTALPNPETSAATRWKIERK